MLYSKASQRFHVFRRLKKFFTKKELHIVYNTFVRSLIEYACPVFVGLDQNMSQMLQKLDNRAHRLIYNLYYGSNNVRLCQCKREEIQVRRNERGKKLFRQIASNKSHILHDRITKRMRSQYSVFMCRTLKRKNSFFPYTTALINKDLSRTPP